MNFQWYPGHMTKAKRQMQEDIKLIDLVIELVDARIPLSSRNPDIDELGKNKARLILLNKSDLSDERKNETWASYFKEKGFYVVKLDARRRGCPWAWRGCPPRPAGSCFRRNRRLGRAGRRSGRLRQAGSGRFRSQGRYSWFLPWSSLHSGVRPRAGTPGPSGKAARFHFRGRRDRRPGPVTA
mgnify:CR=1 FL=1